MNKIVRAGFTIVELIIVMFVIGVLVTVAIVSYQNIQNRAVDNSVLSDIDNMDGLQSRYGIAHDTGGKPYYSLAPTSGSYPFNDADLDFRPTNGTIIDVVTNSTDYCMRGYNPKGLQYVSLATAAYKESTTGVCTSLSASTPAQVDSPS